MTEPITWFCFVAWRDPDGREYINRLHVHTDKGGEFAALQAANQVWGNIDFTAGYVIIQVDVIPDVGAAMETFAMSRRPAMFTAERRARGERVA
jgi:hypothetical protein